MEISIADAHNHLSALLVQVKEGPIHITRHGKTVGVLVSPEEYEALRQVKAYIQMLNLSAELHESASAAQVYRDSRLELEEKR
jgi:prevent-host-death family protein